MAVTKIVVWSLVAVASLGLIGWRLYDKSQADKALQSGKGKGGGAQLVETTFPKPADIRQTIDGVCSLESPYRVQLSPTTSGQIKSITVREGDVVKPGQVLVTLDPADAISQVNQAKGALAEARSRYAQAKLTEGSTNVGVISQIQQQQAVVKSASANADQIKRNYDSAISSAKSQVLDATAKVAAAKAQVANAQAAVNRENATLTNLKIKLQRITSLYQQGFAAAQDVDDAKAAFDAQASTVKVAEAQLNAAQGAVDSAQAQLSVAKDNQAIAERKARADIVAANAALDQSNAQLNTAKSNVSQGPAYAQNLSALASAVSAAEAQLTQANVKLTNTQLKSTILGTVTARNGDPGTLASPGQPLVVVQFLDWLFATTSVPIENAGRIFVGQTANIALDSISTPLTGKIVQINQAADPTSRQFLVRIKLDNSAHLYRPGMFGHVYIITRETHSLLTLPKESIQSASTNPTVATVTSDLKVHIQPVTLGDTDGVVYEIKSGLTATDRVISRSYDAMKEGQPVKLPEAGGGKGGGKGGSKSGSDGSGGGKS